MNTNEIYDRLNVIFQEIFERDDLMVSAEMAAVDIEEWDSLNHINLILAIEQEFSVKFALGELDELKNVGSIVDMISRHANFG